MRLISNRNGIHRRMLALALLLFTASFGIMRAQTAPTASFSTSTLEVTVGQLKFTRPTLSVTDPTSTGKPIRGKFVERWHIMDKDGKIVTTSKIVDNRVKFTDPTTGSTVSLLYGLDSIGNKPGTFTVVGSLLPLPRYKNDYKAAEAKYTVIVKSPTVTAEYYNGSTLLNGTTTNSLQLFTYGEWNSTSVPVPTAKLYYKVDNATYEVTSYYDYTYSATTGFTVNNNTITSSQKTSDGTGTLTITATPKDAYKDMLGSDPITTTVGLKSTYRTDKLRLISPLPNMIRTQCASATCPARCSNQHILQMSLSRMNLATTSHPWLLKLKQRISTSVIHQKMHSINFPMIRTMLPASVDIYLKMSIVMASNPLG